MPEVILQHKSNFKLIYFPSWMNIINYIHPRLYLLIIFLFMTSNSHSEEYNSDKFVKDYLVEYLNRYVEITDYNAINKDDYFPILRWNEPLAIRIIASDSMVRGSEFEEKMEYYANAINSTTSLPIQIFSDSKPANIYIIIGDDIKGMVTKFSREIFNGQSVLEDKFLEEVNDKSRCRILTALYTGTHITRWAAIAVQAKDTHGIYNGCFPHMIPILLGASRYIGTGDTLLNISHNYRFSESDLRWLRLLYSLPVGRPLSAREIEAFIRENSKVLR